MSYALSAVPTCEAHTATPDALPHHLSSFGSQHSARSFAYGIACDPHGHVWVCDAHCVRVFDSDGFFLFGALEGHVRDPFKVDVDAKHGQVFIADGHSSHAIIVCGLSATLTCKAQLNGGFLRRFGSHGKGPGQLHNPSGVHVVDNPNKKKSGEIMVTETYNHRVQILTRDGDFVRKWGREGIKDGEFLWPTGLISNDEGDIFVCDTGNHRIQVFDKNGVYRRQFGSKGFAKGQFNSPRAIVYDRLGQILVLDCDNFRVQVFKSDGTFITMFDWRRLKYGNLEARSLCVDQEGKVYVGTNGVYSVHVYAFV